MRTQKSDTSRYAEVSKLISNFPPMPRCWRMLYHRLIHDFPDNSYAGWRVQLHRDTVLVVEVIWHDLESAVTYAVEAADELFPSEWEGFKW